MRKIFFVITVFLSIAIAGSAQDNRPFWNEIKAFKKLDSINMPPTGGILFIGSSSFRKWTSIQQDFKGYKIINRGFGGSVFPDIIGYVDDIVKPYHPAQVVIYCGDNDLAFSNTVTPNLVKQRFIELFNAIRKIYPKSKILFVSIKPSPSRKKLLPAIEESNKLIKDFLDSQKNTAYADVFHPMMSGTSPMGELFTNDSLHMNEKGYAIWTRVIQPFLIKK